jgi:hypothetical protein
MTNKKIVNVLLLAIVLYFNVAYAHVKWFAPYNIVIPPLPICDVLTKTFVYFFLFSVACIYIFFLVDRGIIRSRFSIVASHYDQFIHDELKLNKLSYYIMRGSAGIFFVSLWLYYIYTGKIIFLTPELFTTQKIIPWIQLILGLCTLSRYTTPITGIGIVALYIAATIHYGIYHLLDYMIFLGIAYFFLVSLSTPTWKKSGFIVLYALTGATLLWAAIEKFGYPYWTYPILAQKHMLMGLSPYAYMVLAGFVEFNITFILLSAASILGRLVAFGLNMIFILAIYAFGLIDAIGHLMIIAILVVFVIRGPTGARNILVLREKSIWMEAYFMTGLYILAFVMFFIMYYGIHYLIYGT